MRAFYKELKANFIHMSVNCVCGTSFHVIILTYGTRAVVKQCQVLEQVRFWIFQRAMPTLHGDAPLS